MKKEELFEIIGDINEKYIKEANEIKIKSKKTTLIKWGAIAACFIVCTVSVFAYTYTDWGTRILNMFTSRIEPGTDYGESGYDLSININKIPVKQLKGNIQSVAEIIAQQFKNYNPLSSKYPGSWQKYFTTSAEARNFIGLDTLKSLNWNLEEQGTNISVNGKPNQINFVHLETDYRVDDIRLQSFSYIYTENYEGDITYSARTTENMEFTESYYTTANQLQCHIIFSTAMESGYLCMDGFIVKDGILYSLHIAYLNKDEAKAKSLMYQWADLF